MSQPVDNPQPLSVAELTQRLRQTLAHEFGNVLVEGEVSDIVRASSGHVYFTLKDSSARISAVLWRSAAARLRFDLEEGQQIICRGNVDIYAPRGNYQLIVQSVQPVGQGALEIAFQQLFRRLQSEGLFDPARKRPIPTIPRRIAVVTSPQGAAIRDFVEVLSRRWPGADLTVIPTRVQGAGAAREIARAIDMANAVLPQFDVLVVCRGGGSLEDLWAFNEEPVCRAVASSRIPVVSGVGHEIDVTLCDLTADLRALTPSEAAERIVPDRAELMNQLRIMRGRMAAGLSHRLRTAQQTVDMLASRPVIARPLDGLDVIRRRLLELAGGLRRPMDRRTDRARHLAAELGGRLETLSPLAVLRRGYSITTTRSGKVIETAAEISAGEAINIRIADGTISARTLAIVPNQKENPQ